MPLSPQIIPSDYFREATIEGLFPGRGGCPLELDLGCGDGGFLLEMAAAFPERNFLGVERLKGRVHMVGSMIRRSGLANVRLLRLDTAYVVGWLLPPASVTRIHLLFPDPWPKKRHHKNRIVRSGEFLAGLGRVLVPDGEFLHKTDREDYFEEAREAMDGQPWAERLGWEEGGVDPYPQTDFEHYWLSLGRSIYRARWRRK